ncbi:uncharacterized protein nompA [Panulirus ornatus]|uniref:uncharacterized protein nompA n=1 Tax=Panulirus ornatus TaxID=150431 RepID=UPI003A85F2EF
MPSRTRATSMFNAVAIVSALHLLSEGVFPAAEGTGEPYGINRQVVEGAARAGTAIGGATSAPRQLDARPAPALNQVVTSDDPGPGEVVDKQLSGESNITAVTLGRDPIRGEGGDPEDLKPSGNEASVPACNDGAGLVRFERLPDTVTEPTSVKFDAIRKKVTPVEVLGLCVDRCLEDETVLGFKTVCTAFDHHPGKRINSYNNAISFTETKCFLTRPQDQFIDVTYRNEKDSVHYRKVCYTASVVRAECPARLYAMERLRNKRFLPKDSLKVAASTIEECQDNTVDRRCPKNKLMFLKAVNTELWGPHDTEVHRGVELDECKELCIDSVSIFCRSFEYDTASKVCTLSDEDTISKPSQVRSSSSNSHQYYQVICIDGEHVRANYIFHDSTDTQQLNQRRYSDVRTAFQLFRDSRLELGSGFRGYHEVPGRLTLAECLDECLEERTFTCRSVMHSEHSQVCRLSEYDQLNGRLAPDGEYNYFENLIENLMVSEEAAGSGDASSSSAAAGRRTGVASDQENTGGDDEAGPGTAGQTGSSQPGLGIRFPGDRSGNARGVNNGFRGSGVSSDSRGGSFSGNSFARGGNRADGSRVSSEDDRYRPISPSRPLGTPLQDRPGLFRPISTDFNSFGGSRGTANRGFSGGRQTDSGGSHFGVGLAATDPLSDMRVSQLCTEDGMEFTLRTDEPFRGRIYTYGYYDRCFIRGSGSSVTNLRITGPRGSPDCGTTKYGDTTTNIVVVQFADNVQTSLDKRYNLTCTVVGPGEAVVTSGYIGAGCPVDNYVFPALGKGRDGDGLEARFNAFKIPEASFLIFEATVRTCRRGCEPARCTLGNGREDTPSYGRKRRDAGDAPDTPEDDAEDEDEDEGQVHGIYEVYLSREEIDDPSMSRSLVQEVCLAPVQYYSLVAALVITIVCLVSALLAVAFCFRRHRQLDEKNATADAGNPYHQPQHLQPKNKFSFPGSHARTLTQPARQVYFPSSEPTASAPQGEDGAATSSRFPDPSEPIYTDPALFERSMSELPARRRYADGEE